MHRFDFFHYLLLRSEADVWLFDLRSENEIVTRLIATSKTSYTLQEALQMASNQIIKGRILELHTHIYKWRLNSKEGHATMHQKRHQSCEFSRHKCTLVRDIYFVWHKAIARYMSLNLFILSDHSNSIISITTLFACLRSNIRDAQQDSEVHFLALLQDQYHANSSSYYCRSID